MEIISNDELTDTLMNQEYSDDSLNDEFWKIYPNRKKAENRLREEQLSIIRRILSGKDTLNILPTGGGKSACFLVPAMLLPGITIVISPLISLIMDQVTILRKSHIPVACITGSFLVDHAGFHHFKQSSTMKNGKDEENDDKKESKRKIRNGIFLDIVRAQNSPEETVRRNSYKILYVTPERLRSGQFIRFAERAKISLFVVDEAHCVSLWGYEFRKPYLEFRRFFKRIEQRPIIAAFTATATHEVKGDIKKYLTLDVSLDDTNQCREIQKRDNLKFSAFLLDKGSTEAESESRRRQKIREQCIKLLKEFDSENSSDCILIYCITVSQVVEYFDDFSNCNELKDHVAMYYADLDSAKKAQNWKAFKKNKKRIMIATTALGMGVDKDNIRYIIHAGMPLSLENYYQEAGRAGRGQGEGNCIIYYVDYFDAKKCHALIDLSLAESGLSGKKKELRMKVMNNRFEMIQRYFYYTLNYNPSKDDLDPQEYIVEYFNNPSPGQIDMEDDDIEDAKNSFEKEIDEIDVLYANRTLISQKIRKGCMEDSGIYVGKEGFPYTVSYQISGGTISYMDMMVADAVYTLLRFGRKKIYARNIIELLTGNHGIQLASNKTSMINDSLRKMSSIRIRIHMNDSTKMCFIYDDERENELEMNTVLEGPFLPLKEAKNGFEQIEKKLPPLYQYAEFMNGQFHTFPLSLLNVREYKYDSTFSIIQEESKRIPSNLTTMAMTHYLLRRIDPILRRSSNRWIKFDTMTEELEEFFQLKHPTAKAIAAGRESQLRDSSSKGRRIREIKEIELQILTHFVEEKLILIDKELFWRTIEKKKDIPIEDSIHIDDFISYIYDSFIEF